MQTMTLKLAQLNESAVNPRLNLAENLDVLVESIQRDGILQPLLVSETKDGYVILAGHRRAAAAALAGLTEVPVLVRKVPEQDRPIIHLVENLQREDLRPADTGFAIYQAIKDKTIRQKDLALTLGKSETWISKFKTIGEALHKTFVTGYEQRRQERLWEIESAEDAYRLAYSLLNGDKPEKVATPTVEPNEDASEEQEYVPPTLEQIIQERIDQVLHGVGEFKINQTKDGTTKVEVKVESETAAKIFFGVR